VFIASPADGHIHEREQNAVTELQTEKKPSWRRFTPVRQLAVRRGTGVTDVVPAQAISARLIEPSLATLEIKERCGRLSLMAGDGAPGRRGSPPHCPDQGFATRTL